MMPDVNLCCNTNDLRPNSYLCNMSVATPHSPRKPQRMSIFRRLIRFIRPYIGLFIIGLTLTLTLSLLNPARPYLVQYVLDHPVMEGDLSSVRFWVMVLIAMMIGQVILMYFQILITNSLGQSVINDLRIQVFNHLTHLRMKYFDTHPIGTLQTRAISDIQTLSNIFSEGLVSIVGELLQLATLLGLMFYTNWRLTLVVMTIVPILILTTYIFKKAVTAAFQRVRKYVAELNTFLQEHITGMLIVQLFNQKEREAQKFDAINRLHTKAHLDTVLYYSIFFPAVELITALSLALLVWYGAEGVLEGFITFGTLVSFLIYIQMFFRPIRMLADQFNSLQMGIVSAERIFNVLDTHEFIHNPADGLRQIPNEKDGIRIVFDDVRFAYNDFATEPILKGVSFTIEPNTTTAIVGATGAGKSSIINVLMRFYDLTAGTITLNGVPIDRYRLETLRGCMGLVMQDVFLFSGSIYENVTLGDHSVPLARVEEAAKQIGVHRFIEQLPGGYQFQVGERGGALSTGQRQLISFLRVMIADPQVLLMDEATANIDSETEHLVQQAINTVLTKRTAIIIAHRLSTIQRADQIIVLHKGNIVEKGSHQQLLALNGYYKKLYLLQYGKAVEA